MPGTGFHQKTPNSFHEKKIFMGWVGVFIFSLFILGLNGCTDKASQSISGYVVDEKGNPVEGATVRKQTTSFQTASDPTGYFTLNIPQSNEKIALTAWAAGYFNAGPVWVDPGETKAKLELVPHSNLDNPDYQWLSAFTQVGEGENQGCAECHGANGGTNFGSLTVDEWVQDAHSKSAQNPQFLTMYSGTDHNGNQSPQTRFVSKKDYGTEPLAPNSSVPYYGPGYKLDFPDTTGNCASCHTPLAAVDEPYNSDPLAVDGVATEGISCDFCHKIWDIILDPKTGLPNQNMPGVLSYQFRRPYEGHQFFAGPFDDVAPGEDTFSPLQTQSQFCAPCHFGVFWDTVVYDSFGEWLRSPYNDPETGQTCQDCHMPRLGVDHFALPEKGGLTRNPDTIFSHRMPGASDEVLLQNAVSMTVTATIDRDNLQVQVTLTNDQTGHHVPTDSPLRHLILVINAQDEGGQHLQLWDGPRLPAWCGEGNPEDGYYAGLPGQVYAKLLAEQWTNKSPTGAYWNPTYLVSDNRLAALSSDTTTYIFEIPRLEEIQIHVRLLYRRAFIELIDQKGWQTPDILMEEEVIRIER